MQTTKPWTTEEVVKLAVIKGFIKPTFKSRVNIPNAVAKGFLEYRDGRKGLAYYPTQKARD